ncbi:glycosyl transferase [Desulfosporosinus acidiphilus SJ4]|uniref:Glycosyl transferase n=1 Tax=Desulfosporosinus acidiphilus (strain DSM 22704 / JCM 16185 / SJ4) TaxID=646529 RepID=I4D1I7_DESAJ|nr:TPR domain-containing glycosyltransferase [Desulfosporosinus acidiphilus]AFM39661.1 glycosyl transferase [Desulfosporosinus acidiphilus SJ4]
MAIKISLCMIVKNEADNLNRCLKSVSDIVDEIIIVDTGSTDSTCDIAQQHGAKVHHFLWNDNFSDARNSSLDRAQGDWVLFLDADEELSPSSRDRLTPLLECEDIEGYFVKIINYLGREGWTETVPDLVFRLFRNKKEYRFRGAIHEQIADVILEKNTQAKYQIAEDFTILHYGYSDHLIQVKDKKYRNISLIEKELAKQPANRLLQFHYGVELFRAERYTEASEIFIQAAENTDPHTIYFPKLLRYLVIAQQSSGQLKEALNTAEIGLKLFPNYADLYYYSGLLQRDLKHYSQARNAFLQALSMPEQPPQYASFGGVRGFRSYYCLAQIAELFLDEEEALKYYLLSLRDNPNFTLALESLVSILKPAQEPDYAEECLKRICDFCTPEANRLMGEIYYKHGAYDLALDYFEKAADGVPVMSQLKLKRAICLLQARRYFESLRLLEDFTPESPDYALAVLNRLFCYWLQDMPHKVRSIWKELYALGLEQNTENVLSLFLMTQDKTNPSGQINLNSDGVLLLLDIVQRLVNLQEIERALFFLQTITSECLCEYALQIAQIFMNYGQEIQALPFLNTALEQKPTSEIHFQRAEIYSHLGKLFEAEQDYQVALKLDPNSPRPYLRLIDLYTASRQNILQEALAKFPANQTFVKLAEGGSDYHEAKD